MRGLFNVGAQAGLGQSVRSSFTHTHTRTRTRTRTKEPLEIPRKTGHFAYRASRDCCRPVPQMTTSHGSSVRDSMVMMIYLFFVSAADVLKEREKLFDCRKRLAFGTGRKFAAWPSGWIH